MDSIERIGILIDRVEGCLNITPLPLLTSRYFDSLIKSHNLISLQLIFGNAKLVMKKKLDDINSSNNNTNNNNSNNNDITFGGRFAREKSKKDVYDILNLFPSICTPGFEDTDGPEAEADVTNGIGNHSSITKL
ncbi:hypothetical protein RFI_03156 [Reticulomyxa filosa]|uniref:Uncharacterized protein n=1 Tax=Reticulomyxa filosa TaxID=46433 RepID=X6P603_RETFI|nr:hypothetical protein RFI_03156 [Reticulomyxa filosa]|eukprot:ETO33940.1 hypothetical protein RFI_03156 [Reticulomyxa filosa]